MAPQPSVLRPPSRLESVQRRINIHPALLKQWYTALEPCWARAGLEADTAYYFVRIGLFYEPLPRSRGVSGRIERSLPIKADEKCIGCFPHRDGFCGHENELPHASVLLRAGNKRRYPVDSIRQLMLRIVYPESGISRDCTAAFSASMQSLFARPLSFRDVRYVSS